MQGGSAISAKGLFVHCAWVRVQAQMVCLDEIPPPLVSWVTLGKEQPLCLKFLQP